MFELSSELQGRFEGSFEAVMELEGPVYREKEGRRTLSFIHQGREYFAKIHRGVGWKEIFKNLLSFKRPALDASTEWKAVAVLEECGIATVEVVGKGIRGGNPARRESFVIMRALAERVEVEDFLKDLAGWDGVDALRLKRAIIREVAGTARGMHEAGMNHRDFYLCHFHVMDRDWSGWTPEEDLRVPVLDLHRSQIRSRVPRRWLVKDLASLLYSSLDCGVTDRDLLAFLRVYLGPDWKARLARDASLWQAVAGRALRLYRKHCGISGRLPGVFASFS